MSDDPEEAADGLVPRGARALTIKSAQLVTRGLQDLEVLQDLDAICDLGESFFEGEGVKQDYAAAAKYFRIAAEGGHARAQHNLALMYENGEGVPQDYFEAARWYRMAAEQGNAGSQNNLGGLYEEGLGVAQDQAAALKWYSKGAEGGDALAHSNVQRLTARVELENYREIVSAFTDFVAEHSPLIGDSSLLPYPKDKILYAIKYVVSDGETRRELATEPKLIEMYDRMIPTLNYLFTHLVDAWHDIAPEDKDAIARLSQYDSFPEWALPLKEKYIDDERASKEALEVAFRVMKDKFDREKEGTASQKEAPLDKEEDLDEARAQYNFGKSCLREGRFFEALTAFETALATNKDSELYAYALGLVAALVGDYRTADEQMEALAVRGLTPLSDELFQFLKKYSTETVEFSEDEEFNRLMSQLLETKIHAAELLTRMAQEFDRIASGPEVVGKSKG